MLWKVLNQKTNDIAELVRAPTPRLCRADLTAATRKANSPKSASAGHAALPEKENRVEIVADIMD